MPVKVPDTPTIYTTKYNNLKGVDYSVDSSQVNKKRTPNGLNMIPDAGGNPEKRKGWSILHTVSSKIDNLWSFIYDDVRYYLVTYGTNLVQFTDDDISFTPFTLNSSGKKAAMYSQNATTRGFYIFDDSRIIKATPTAGVLSYAEISYYTPLVIIARDPVNGGGVLYENINKMTRVRKERFINSGSYVGSAWTAVASTDVLDSSTAHGLTVNDPVKFSTGTGALPAGLDVSMTYYVKTVPTTSSITVSDTVGGTVIDITSTGTAGWKVLAPSKSFLCTSVISGTPIARYKDSTGTWQTATVSSSSGATVNISTRYLGTTEDNIEIEYTASGSGTKTDVCSCREWARYNQQTVDLIFVTANSIAGYGQYVYYSAYGDISYWPDQNYLYIGGSGSNISGFLNVSENLAVIKEDNAQEATLFFLYSTTLTVDNQDGTTSEVNTFASKQTTSGVGAVGSAKGILIDEPVFLSPTGIYGITSKNYTTEKIVRNRSVFVNSKLTKELNLENAVACVWKDYFLLFVNSHVYILDGKQKTNDTDTGSFAYECYYWDNVPADVVICADNYIYFCGYTDSNYSICKFNTAEASSSYSDNGTAITATWATPYDSDNGTQYYKVLQKKGSICTLKPYFTSSVNIYYAVDGKERELSGTGSISIGGFGSFDFGNWTFSGSSYPQDKFFEKKKKKYKRLQIILENSTLNEGFGVIEITKTWYSTGYSKEKK